MFFDSKSANGGMNLLIAQKASKDYCETNFTVESSIQTTVKTGTTWYQV